MIIWGTRGITSTKDRGEFHCPKCQARSAYQLKSVRRFFTLYFIPMIPLNQLGQFVHCTQCRSDFNESVLKHNPDELARTNDAVMKLALIHVLVDLAASDGVVFEAQRAQLRQVYRQVTGEELSDEWASKFTEHAASMAEPLPGILGEIGKNISADDKELIVRGAYHMARARGGATHEQVERIRVLAGGLRMSPAHLRGIEAECVDVMA